MLYIKRLGQKLMVRKQRKDGELNKSDKVLTTRFLSHVDLFCESGCSICKLYSIRNALFFQIAISKNTALETHLVKLFNLKGSPLTSNIFSNALVFTFTCFFTSISLVLFFFKHLELQQFAQFLSFLNKESML